MRPSTLDQLALRLGQSKPRGRRLVVALAGAPGSGKSTMAAQLSERLHHAAVVPMDGFHLDNRLLEPRGLLPRKGAPETFDLGGITRLAQALAQDETVYYPLFDRARDLAVAGAGHIGPECQIALIEGNYLMFDAPGWRDLAGYWDVSVRLDVPLEVLRARLIARWLAHGLSPDQAAQRAQGNDLPNAERVLKAALPCDYVLRTDA
ncbi:fructose transport system kinase [Actibacterium atlanticum]|uniref:Fructose transport system kinase n=1 Tax=Actibacterium atlanticum TaxID=1461693 RepID=A0A058ZIL5_9RHOB|nr:hypothetical protein [Actibacterium atlanticum]KCV81032.1 fructose transport system kinase [Actibacterium atlanticum]